ncbi:hypothetical protein [Candidatus Cyanaurora vandensis]|nr:hypothetical protein [Candidatus Cyanaurora vandensis]
MKGNAIFLFIIAVFLFTLVLVSSRSFLPQEMRQPAPVPAQP